MFHSTFYRFSNSNCLEAYVSSFDFILSWICWEGDEWWKKSYAYIFFLVWKKGIIQHSDGDGVIGFIVTLNGENIYTYITLTKKPKLSYKENGTKWIGNTSFRSVSPIWYDFKDGFISLLPGVAKFNFKSILNLFLHTIKSCATISLCVSVSVSDVFRLWWWSWKWTKNSRQS